MNNIVKILSTKIYYIYQFIPVSWLVFIIAFIATLWSWFIVDRISQQQIRSNIFEYRVERIKNAITQRMLAYQQLLQGGVGLFNASESVKRYEWRNYVNSLQIDKYYPGIQGVGFSQRILPQEKAAHIAQIRAEGGFFRNYTIKPLGEREEYTSIVYLEPLDERNQHAIGYDMFSEPVRQLAMVQARDTGEPTLSGKVTLVQEINEDVQHGFLLYIPVYRQGYIPTTVAERHESLVGYVYSPFRIKDFMRGIFGKQSLNIDFHIYDGDNSIHLHPNNLIYDEVDNYHDQNDRLSYSPPFTQISLLEIAGHTWTIHYATLPYFETTTKTYTAHLVLFGGLIMAFLLFKITRSFETARLLMLQRQTNVQLRAEIYERQQIEQALLESQKQLRMITNNIPAFIAYVDANQIYHFANKHYEEWFGLSNVIGLSVKQVVGEIAYDSIKNYINTVLSGKPVTFEITLPHQDGNVRWVQGKYFPDINLEGSVVGYFVLIVDMTERKQMELALRQSEERFELAMRGANDGLWDWNIITNEVYFSPRWKQMLGYADHEIRHHLDEWVERVHPEDLSNTISEVNKYFINESKTYENIHRVRHKEGHYVWILDRGIAIRNAEGKPIRMVGTHTDLTTLKQTEEALRQSEEKYRRIVETTREGVWVIDAQAHTTYVNTTMANMLGYSEEEMLGKHLFYFMDEAEQRYVSQNFEHRQHGISETHDFRFRRKNGSDLWAIVATTVITDRNGRFLGSLGMITDITQRKQIEFDLQRAKETAEVANRAKSAFLANMSHELRTPLNGILGYAQILDLDDQLTKEQKQSIRIIRRSGEYLLTLINDILDLAKVEAGKIELSPVAIRLDEFIKDIMQLFESRTRQKNIQLSYQATSELPNVVLADETRLRQILINLLSNAVKFTEQGKITLIVSCDLEETFYFQIEDTGCGILKEDLDKIFLPFQQVGDKKHQMQGTGLGLPITRRLVEMMGGTLYVTSMLGQGSTFRISLKLPKVSDFLQRVQQIPPLKIIGYQGPRRSVLIVDDSSINRLILLKMLNHIGFNVLEATGGQEALDKIREIPFIDLVLIDLIMPELNGFEAIQRLRQIPTCQKTVIIAVSASAFDSDRQKSIELGCNDFIAKPVKFDLLLERLQKHLGLTWLHSSATTSSIIIEDKLPLEAPMVQLADAQIIDLLEFAKKGDVQAILEYTEDLEKLNQEFIPFAHYIHELAKKFRLKEIRKIMQQFPVTADS